jgi:hypothetical protein
MGDYRPVIFPWRRKPHDSFDGSKDNEKMEKEKPDFCAEGDLEGI